MSANTSPPSDGNTYIFEKENAAEMARLIRVDRFTTQGMGGPLADQADLTAIHRILDVACGPGGWVLEVASLYPDKEVTGIDLSESMITYAANQARERQIANTSFAVMDVTKPLDFADATFDLVNGRLLCGFLLRTMWPHFLRECFRITRPSGILRLTELDIGGVTTSAAFNQLNRFASRAMQRVGYGFSPDGEDLCMTPMLGALLWDAGYAQVQQKAHAIDFSAGTAFFKELYHNYELFFRMLKPLFLATGVTTEDEFTSVYQRMQTEMLHDDFRGIWYFLTAWGTKTA